MSGPITYEQLTWFLAELSVVAGLMLAVWRAVVSRIEKAETSAATIRAELAAFQIKVAQEYAKNGYIRDVETRLMDGINGVSREIHNLNSRIDRMLNARAVGNSDDV